MGLFDGTYLERPVLCDRCRQETSLCKCPILETPAEKQTLKFRLDKRKRGKLVTVISGFRCSELKIHETMGILKSQCGAGGSIDGQNIGLQGDHTKRIASVLISQGFQVGKL
ncbi:MAG TPA: translation initiation factor [Pirellula sp.]|nr:translation initiation factor [Pirellula sp.]